MLYPEAKNIVLPWTWDDGKQSMKRGPLGVFILFMFHNTSFSCFSSSKLTDYCLSIRQNKIFGKSSNNSGKFRFHDVKISIISKPSRMVPRYRLFGFICAWTFHKMTNLLIFLLDPMHLNITLLTTPQPLPDDKFSQKYKTFSIYQNIGILGSVPTKNEHFQNILLWSESPQYYISKETSTTPLWLFLI